MFVVIDMSNNKKRLFEKYRYHEIELERHDVPLSAPFFVAKCHKKYTNIQQLKRIVECYGCALFPQSSEIPNEIRELQFKPETLPLKMLIKTVAEHFSKQQELFDTSVSIIDKSAKAGDMLHLLSKHVRYVRVVTNRPDKYALFADNLYSSMGISVEITSNILSAYSSDLVISLNDLHLDGFDKSKILVYEKSTQNKNVFCLNKCDSVYPDFDSKKYNIDSFLFLCALYETCGYRLPYLPSFKCCENTAIKS